MMNRDVNWDVNGAVIEAVRRAVNLAGNWSVYGAMRRAVGLAVHEAVEKRGEPPHPGLGIYLGGVA